MKPRFIGCLIGLSAGVAILAMHASEYADWTGERFDYNLMRLLTTLCLTTLVGAAVGYRMEYRQPRP